MRILILLCVLSLFLGSLAQDPNYCYSVYFNNPSIADFRKCLASISISNQTKENVLDTTKKLMDMYSFKDIVRDSPSSGEFSHVSVDIDAELNRLRNKTINDDSVTAFDFYQAIQDKVFNPLRDAHTQFEKPKCFDVFVLQPFALSARVVNDKFEIYVHGLWSYSSNQLWSVLPLSSKISLGIQLINGVPADQALITYSNAYPRYSKDPSVNFNTYLSYAYVQRNLMFREMPASDTVTYTFSDGSTLVVPWLIDAHAANLRACDNEPTLLESEESEQNKDLRTIVERPKTTVVITSTDLKDTTEEKLGADSKDLCDYTVYSSKSVSISSTSKSNVKVLRIKDFEDSNMVSTINSALNCFQGLDVKNLILDMRSNGGGYVCQGLGLVKLLHDDPPPALYDLRHNAILDQLVSAADYTRFDTYLFGRGFWLDPQTHSKFYGTTWYNSRSLSRGGVTHLYSQILEYPGGTCFDYPPSLHEFDQILIVTDGHCGSTCAIASTLLRQHNDKVKTVAVGGIPTQEQMSFSTFPGGIVKGSADLFNYIKKFAISGSFVPSLFPTTATLSLTFSELYLSSEEQNVPEEFMFLPADHRILSWPDVHDQTASAKLYEDLLPLFKNQLSGLAIFGIVLGCIVGCGIISLVVFIVVRSRRRAKQGYQEIQ